jgi:hypothetical protein
MSNASSEMPIFTRTFDFLTWLLPVTNRFPRAQRFTVTKRLLDAAFDLREHLETAQHRQGWVNHVRYGNTVGLRKALLAEMKIPRRQ